MKALVLVEKVDTHTYRASTAQPIALVAEGPSRDEALQSLGALVQQRLANGELIELPLPAPANDNPWVTFAGVWKDHPDWEAFRKNVATYRRRAAAADSSQ